MKGNTFLLILLSLFFATSYSCNTSSAPELNVMVVAGGHDFDTLEFIQMFDSFTAMEYELVMQPRANQMIAKGELDDYNVIVFYDMWADIDSSEMKGYLELMAGGKGMVFLHHSLAGYQKWDEYIEILGGKYHTEASDVSPDRYSTYKHDLDLEVKITRSNHPVTRNLKDFVIHDEGYGNVEVQDDIMVLLSTENPDCTGPIAWVNTYKNSAIVYIMLGHDKQAYSNEEFRKLLANAISFVKKPS